MKRIMIALSLFLLLVQSLLRLFPIRRALSPILMLGLDHRKEYMWTFAYTLGASLVFLVSVQSAEETTDMVNGVDRAILPGPNGGRTVTFAAISNLSPQNKRTRKYQLFHDFTTTYFKDYGVVIPEWPAVYTGNCPHPYNPLTNDQRLEHDLFVEGENSTTELDVRRWNANGVPDNLRRKPWGFQRGLTIAHKEVWEEFVQNHLHIPHNQSASTLPVLVVFEDDAICVMENCQNVTMKWLQSMSTDLAYLGWCSMDKAARIPPVCTHAYAVSVHGARKLLHEIKPCRQAIDLQLHELGKQGAITWSFPDVGGIRDLRDDIALSLGVRFPAHVGGLFLQLEVEPLPHFPDGTILKTPFSKTTYFLMNQTVHRFPNLDTFIKMGLDFSNTVQITEWQFQQYREGEQLPIL
jgi:hypothetical protein